MKNLQFKVLCLFIFLLLSQIRAGEIEYFKGSLEKARKEAQASKKTILLKFTASWCAPCRKMDAGTLRSKDIVQSLNENFLVLNLDVDQPLGRNIASQQKVSRIPTFIIIDPKSGEAISRTEGYMDVEQMKNLLTPYQ